MRRYLGCDAHASSCSFGVLSPSGKRLRHDVVETSAQALIDYLREIPGELHVCLEEGEQSEWLVEVLSAHVAEVVVVISERKRGHKSDKVDAFGLAEVLQTGKRWKRVYKDPQRLQRLRELGRMYRMVRQDLVRTKNRVKHFYRARGVGCRGDEVYGARQRKAWLAKVPVATRSALGPLYQELDAMATLKAEAETALVKESHRHRIARVLETAPGMGPVRVAQMLPIVVTPHRFRTSRQFWSYCGLGIVTRSSSDYVQQDGRWLRMPVVQTRGLSREYNRVLKTIFKGAATTITQQTSHPVHTDYERLLETGVKPNLAKLTLARKIAAMVLAMWKQEQRYDPKRRRTV